ASALGRRAAGFELAELVANAPPKAFSAPLHALEQLQNRTEAIAALDRILEENSEAQPDQLGKERVARRQANAAIALSAFGMPDRTWPNRRPLPAPRLRSLLIDRLARLDVSHKPLLDELGSAVHDPMVRQALLMAIAELVDRNRSRFPPTASKELVDTAV